MEIRLKLNETWTNNTGKPAEVQTNYPNVFGLMQNHFSNITPGMSITKTRSDTVVIIYTD